MNSGKRGHNFELQTVLDRILWMSVGFLIAVVIFALIF